MESRRAFFCMAGLLVWWLLIPSGPSRLAYAAAPAAGLFRDGHLAIDGPVCRRSCGLCFAGQPLLVHAVQERGHVVALHRLVGGGTSRCRPPRPIRPRCPTRRANTSCGRAGCLRPRRGTRRAPCRGLEGGLARQVVEVRCHVAADDIGIGTEGVGAVAVVQPFDTPLATSQAMCSAWDVSPVTTSLKESYWGCGARPVTSMSTICRRASPGWWSRPGFHPGRRRSRIRSE